MNSAKKSKKAVNKYESAREEFDRERKLIAGKMSERTVESSVKTTLSERLVEVREKYSSSKTQRFNSLMHALSEKQIVKLADIKFAFEKIQKQEKANVAVPDDEEEFSL